MMITGDLRNSAILSFWVGWLLTLGVAEWWIRRTASVTTRAGDGWVGVGPRAS